MRITVRIKPGARTESVEKLPGNGFLVRVKAPAIEGRANKALISALSGYFDVPKTRISITSGLNSKNKLIDIL